jgi:hypothetical protein
MYNLTINKTVERDNYFNGCTDSFQDLGDILNKNFSSLDDLVSFISKNYKLDSMAIFDDHLIFQCNEDGSGYPIVLSGLRPETGWHVITFLSLRSQWSHLTMMI